MFVGWKPTKDFSSPLMGEIKVGVKSLLRMSLILIP